MAEKPAHRKYTTLDKLRAVGPAIIITGSFIGPGTVTTAMRTGADFGYAMVWTVIFAILATIVLQGLAARLGIVTGQGFSEAISRVFENKLLKYSSMGLVGIAVPLGCIAYIGGDLTGSAVGLSNITGVSTRVLGPMFGVFIIALIALGGLKVIERVLMVLVAIMAIVFVISMIVVEPDWGAVAAGIIPSIPPNGLFLVLGLIGTTIVPYNLFIHAVNARKHFNSPEELELSTWDLYISISIGGLITVAILVTAGTVMRGMQIEGISEMSDALRPILGGFAPIFLSIGMISAGLSSAIAVPLGASYVLAGLFGWKYDRTDNRFLIVNIAVLVFGILISATGFRPVYIILAAQVLNGVILPLAVIFLVIITSMPRFMGRYANTVPVVIVGGLIALITISLGARSLFEMVVGN